MVNILGMVIKSEYQRKGIGKLLMEQAENWGRKIGARKIRLNSAMTRKGAHEFYRKLGYLDEKNQIRFLKEL